MFIYFNVNINLNISVSIKAFIVWLVSFPSMRLININQFSNDFRDPSYLQWHSPLVLNVMTSSLVQGIMWHQSLASVLCILANFRLYFWLNSMLHFQRSKPLWRLHCLNGTETEPFSVLRLAWNDKLKLITEAEADKLIIAVSRFRLSSVILSNSSFIFIVYCA